MICNNKIKGLAIVALFACSHMASAGESSSANAKRYGYYLNENAGVKSDPVGNVKYRKAAAENNARLRALGVSETPSNTSNQGPGRNVSR